MAADPKTALMSAYEGAPAEVVEALKMYGVYNFQQLEELQDTVGAYCQQQYAVDPYSSGLAKRRRDHIAPPAVAAAPGLSAFPGFGALAGLHGSSGSAGPSDSPTSSRSTASGLAAVAAGRSTATNRYQPRQCDIDEDEVRARFRR